VGYVFLQDTFFYTVAWAFSFLLWAWLWVDFPLLVHQQPNSKVPQVASRERPKTNEVRGTRYLTSAVVFIVGVLWFKHSYSTTGYVQVVQWHQLDTSCTIGIQSINKRKLSTLAASTK
jgi:hypothetical protein